MVRLQVILLSACIGLSSALGNAVESSSAAAIAASSRCAKDPIKRVDCYPLQANFPEPTEELCLAQGCCWRSLDNEGIPCAFANEEPPREEQCEFVAKPSRLACRNPRFALAELVKDADTCESAGCCYDDEECYQPLSDGYELLTLDETSNGWHGILALRHGSRGPFGNDVPILELNVVRETSSRVRIRIIDPAFSRYEVPDLPVRRQKRDEDDSDEDSDYKVHFTPWPFGVAVSRRGSGEVLFNSTPPVEKEAQGKSFSGLVFENQFLEISTQLSVSEDDDEPILYGLGERLGPMRVHADKRGDLYPMFSRAPNTSAPAHFRRGGDNSYGVHPFVLQLKEGEYGNAHGIFMLSSNAMEVLARRSALTYRLTGGVIDIFIFSGSSPEDVIEQYTDVVGRPAMPPYWALGYHVGLRGEFVSVDKAMKVVNQLRMAGIPLEAYWQDLDYMADNGRALSLNESKISPQVLRAFIDELHFHSQYFICAQVPAITLQNTSSHIEDQGGNVAKYNTFMRKKPSPFTLAAHDSSGEDRDASHGEHGGVKRNGDMYESDSDSADRKQDKHSSSRSDEKSKRANEGGEQSWDPVVRGEELDVFVKGVNGERYAQKAFRSGWAVFVDFFHPQASRYWQEQLANFHKYVMPYDGLWLNMNEPSSSCDCALAAEDDICARICSKRPIIRDSHRGGEVFGFENVDVPGDGGFIRTNDVNFPFDPYRQPFVPGQNEPSIGGHGNLNSATLPMAALHYSSLHYNLHSLYGHAQSVATRSALNSIVKKRTLLLSRSTFSGTGHYAGHWLDNDVASWEQLRLSISGTLQMNLLGVPLTGPNVCGSRGQSLTELCVRWHQAASFLPLLRNHADIDGKHIPEDFDADALNILRSTLLRRYRYLPYMYTLFYEASRSGKPVVRPLAFEFPNDKIAQKIEHQYLLGPALMISPVVHEGAISAEVYFPNVHWFDAHNGKLALGTATENNRRVSLLTPLSKLQVHLREGYVVPTQQPVTTTTLSRRGGFTLLAALSASKNSSAFGELYVDDGDSLSAIEDQRYSLMHYDVRQNSSGVVVFKCSFIFHGYDGPEMHADLNEIRLYGIHGEGFVANSSVDATLTPSSSASSSGQTAIKAEYFAQSEMLVLSRFNAAIGQEFYVKAIAKAAETKNGENEANSKAIGTNSSGKSEGEEGETEQKKPTKGSKKSKFSITSIVGIVVGCALLAAIVLVFLFRRRRRGYETV